MAASHKARSLEIADSSGCSNIVILSGDGPYQQCVGDGHERPTPFMDKR
jgi:5,10-methylenetetrahydrofolate reductase